MPPRADPRPGRLRFAGLGYALTVLLTGTNLATPLYASYERMFRLSPLDVTLLVAVYAAAVVVALLICGPLSDTAGYRPVLVAGLSAAVCGSALLAAASGPAWLFAGRAVQGLAVGTCSGALTAGLVLTEPRGRRARASFLAATATTAAVGFGPVLAGALAQYAPAPRVLSFLVEIALLVPAVAVVALLPGSLGRSGRRWQPRWPSLPAPARAAFLSPAVVSLLAWAVAYVVLALVPPTRPRCWAAATCSLTALRLAHCCWPRRSPRPSAGRGTRPGPRRPGWPAWPRACSGSSPPGSSRPGSAALLFAAMAVAGCGQGLAFMGALRQINEIAPAAARAGVVSLFYVVSYAGSGLVTVGVGLLATLLGLAVSVRWFGAVLAAACLLMLTLLRHHHGK